MLLCCHGCVGGSQGDLYVFVKVKEHADLRREGLTVHSDVSVSYVDAILGMPTELVSCPYETHLTLCCTNHFSCATVFDTELAV